MKKTICLLMLLSNCFTLNVYAKPTKSHNEIKKQKNTTEHVSFDESLPDDENYTIDGIKRIFSPISNVLHLSDKVEWLCGVASDHQDAVKNVSIVFTCVYYYLFLNHFLFSAGGLQS